MRTSLLLALMLATLCLVACGDHETPTPSPAPTPRVAPPTLTPPTTAPASDASPSAAVTTVAAAANVKCPVTGEDVDPKDPKLAKFVYEGKTYVVCCPDCTKDLAANPAKYVKAE
jgi:YHS domain-containing protein